MKLRTTLPADGHTADAAASDAVGATDTTGDAGSGASRTVRRASVAMAVTVGAAAAATALAGPADAASSYHVWDRVANCESSNNWHIHTGNGYYGGLQFDSSTWSRHGGHKYAQQASGATRVEQIEVARRVLHDQGRDAWPVCGPRAGLTKSSGHATGAKLPDTAGVDAAHAHRSHKSHHAKHRSHGHAAHHSHKAKHGAHGSYRVRSGDTLASIAHKKHVDGGWKALYHANRGHVHNPNLIHVGQVLSLP